VQVIDYNAESVYKHVVVPNVFTPNGDSNNDLMYISGLNECEPAGLKIFNRWGAEVFHTLSPIAEPWSGVNHSNEVVEGVYFYLLELEHLSITGYVTIFR
jgi:gliding motility-associated-like protein